MPILGSSEKRRTNAREAQHDDYEGFEVIARRMWVILPSSWFRATWDWILVVFVVYNMISIPLEMHARPYRCLTAPPFHTSHAPCCFAAQLLHL